MPPGADRGDAQALAATALQDLESFGQAAQLRENREHAGTIMENFRSRQPCFMIFSTMHKKAFRSMAKTIARQESEGRKTMAKQLGKAPIPPEAAAIGARIKAAMKAKGLSPADLAKALGMSYAGVSDMIAGRAAKQYLQLSEIARLLGCTPNDLLGWSGKGEHPESSALDLVGAAFEQILMETGWSEADAREAVDIATRSATAESIVNMDRKLAARAFAATELRRHRSDK